MKITNIIGREIYDSRGYPTIACDLTLQDGFVVTASVPSGASIGKYEAVELRDGGKKYNGRGVDKALRNLNSIIAPALIGQVPSLIELDIKMLELDNTDNKSKLGSNAILAVSMAVCKAQAHLEMMEPYELMAYLCGFETVNLPSPMFNVINGGVHAHNNLSVQEFMIMPVGLESFRETMEVGTRTYHALKKLLEQNDKSTLVGDEGGFGPNLDSEKEALDYIMQAIEQVQKDYDDDLDIKICLDIAASQLYSPKTKRYNVHGKSMTKSDLIAWYVELANHYPIFSIEDPLHEDDWDGWEQMMELVEDELQLVGDDIFVTNPERIWKGIEANAASAAIIKPNQIGTVTETLQAVQLCIENNIDIVVSHRSGETNDPFIADLAVAASAQQIKAGGCARGERLAKYNRLLKTEDTLLGLFDQL